MIEEWKQEQAEDRVGLSTRDAQGNDLLRKYIIINRLCIESLSGKRRASCRIEFRKGQRSKRLAVPEPRVLRDLHVIGITN